MKKDLEQIANRLGNLLNEVELPEDAKGIICSCLDHLNEIIDSDDKYIKLTGLMASARLLIDNDGINTEYNRGICELIGDNDGIEDLPLDERCQQIANELKCKI